ncbi:aryl hydrocarbon receptor-like [Leuresthes tenuis]|uniref:aryl hydrocarbon receptor-like n=1 Tax=Leuresthes tenuis TaxID=355514 RepID=UPI003B511938
MLGNPGIYANKKRKKPVLKQKKIPDSNDVVKSNPSKRHRDRLNGELDRLMDLLPFPEEVRSRLDKLSVLRLSVGYLKVKSYFKATMKSGNSSWLSLGVNGQNGKNVDAGALSEGDLLLQALNGFVIVVTSDGLVFYASPTIKDYLGFHQSDVVHQSVFELIHTDDRTLFREQLHFALNPTPVAVDGEVSQSCDKMVMYSPEQLPPENSSFLERSFVCRFRCLLDNSSGFLAMKFQGRLKYLHGQNLSRDNGSRHQLALFAIAIPVQPPSIVEIRAKMLLFQTKHKLDFTPCGVDSRGMIILGYSETELCTKGSGYQFIHAADMMYCAENHLRMIKTGESGLTMFRLLSKVGTWVWVKSNAKLIYKGGRPEFIIAYQRALTNAEGEECLQQRRLQLPFSCATGEAILYDTGPTIGVTQFESNKTSSGKDMKKDTMPSSLLDCFLVQDQSVYTQAADSPLPVDQVFMDSRALVSFASDSWQESEAAAPAGEPVVVKDEAKQSTVAFLDSLEKCTRNGDFDAVLDHLEMDDAELMEWENAIKRFSHGEDRQRSVGSELDSIFTNDILDYIDTFFQEKGEDCLSNVSAGCLSGIDSFPSADLCEPQLFQTLASDHAFSPANGLYAQQQQVAAGGAVTRGQSLVKPSPQTPESMGQADGGLPPLQQLQLQDIFSPSIELPELTVPNISADFTTFQPCQQPSLRPTGRPQAGSVRVQQPNQLLQSSAQPASAAPAVADILRPSGPRRDFSSPSTSTVPAGFPTPPLQENRLLNGSLQQWPQSQPPHAGVLQNGHETLPAFQGPNPESQTFPYAGFWPQDVPRLNHAERGGHAAPQAAAQSSCMYEQSFAAGISGANVSLDQSPQGPGFSQWSRSESGGGAAIIPENANIGRLTAAPGMASTEHPRNIQHYLDNNTHTQTNRGFVAPALDVAAYLME